MKNIKKRTLAGMAATLSVVGLMVSSGGIADASPKATPSLLLVNNSYYWLGVYCPADNLFSPLATQDSKLTCPTAGQTVYVGRVGSANQAVHSAKNEKLQQIQAGRYSSRAASKS
jgi:hypothetical protein